MTFIVPPHVIQYWRNTEKRSEEWIADKLRRYNSSWEARLLKAELPSPDVLYELWINYSLVEIACKYGVTKSIIHKRLKQAGYKSPRKQGQKIKDKDQRR